VKLEKSRELRRDGRDAASLRSWSPRSRRSGGGSVERLSWIGPYFGMARLGPIR
jgi:hypothetical protein